MSESLCEFISVTAAERLENVFSLWVSVIYQDRHSFHFLTKPSVSQSHLARCYEKVARLETEASSELQMTHVIRAWRTSSSLSLIRERG